MAFGPGGPSSIENDTHGIEKLLVNSSKLNKFLHRELNLLMQHIIVHDQDEQNNNIHNFIIMILHYLHS